MAKQSSCRQTTTLRAGRVGLRKRSKVNQANSSTASLLEVDGLRARVAEGDAGDGDAKSDILQGVSFSVNKGEVHAVMGKNGSGKSTLSKALVGHPAYEVTGGTASFNGHDLLSLSPEERSHAGLFLSFQSPIEVPGVSLVDFLRLAYNERQKSKGGQEVEPLEFYAMVMPKLQQLKMDPTFLNRSVNEGFSGGEKKRNEILQLSVLEAELAVLDEVDSGLDIDAMRDVADSVNGLKEEGRSLLLITHYQRMLDLVVPDKVHVMQDGKIINTGGPELAKQIEQEGYTSVATA